MRYYCRTSILKLGIFPQGNGVKQTLPMLETNFIMKRSPNHTPSSIAGQRCTKPSIEP